MFRRNIEDRLKEWKTSEIRKPLGPKIAGGVYKYDNFGDSGLGLENYIYNGKKYKILLVPFYLLENIEKYLKKYDLG